jgi:predicted lysophospholipase L1 biosynthesis ABC-type transport system permease subunit
MEIAMAWPTYIAHFFGAAFAANALPHLTAGIAGQPLQSPFASPPFRGMSSPWTNVVWALANLAAAYVLLVQVGPLDLRNWHDASIAFVGFGGMALLCSRSFAGLRKRRSE